MDTKKAKHVYVAFGFGFLLLLLAASLYSAVACARDEAADLVVARDVQPQTSVSSLLNQVIGQPDETVDEPNETTGESALSRGNIWYAGTWDSLLYFNIRYPRTVAIRMKLLDQGTHQPIKDVNVSLKGEYMQPLAGPDAQNQIDTRVFPDLRKLQPQRRKFGLDVISDADGIVVFSLNWQKEYSWQTKTEEQESDTISVGEIVRPDGIDCTVRVRIRHPEYEYVEMLVDFKHVAALRPGEDASDADNRRTSDRRRGQIRPRTVRSVVLDLDEEFPDFKNKQSRRSEFFEKIRAEDYGMTYEELKSSTERDATSTCGPYFVYDLGDVLLERIAPQPEVRDIGRIAPGTEVSDLVSVLVKDTNDREEVRDSQRTRSPEKPVEPDGPTRPDTSVEAERSTDSPDVAKPSDQTSPVVAAQPEESQDTQKPSDQTRPDTPAGAQESKDSPETTKPGDQTSPVTSVAAQPKESQETQQPSDQTRPDIAARTKPLRDALPQEQPDEKIPSDPKEKIIDLGDGVTMKLLLIPAGTFRMGSGPDEQGRDSDEGPVYDVQIDKPFYMGVYEVTQDQYEKVMKANPSKYKGPNYPVHMVSWHEAREFCRLLSSVVGGRFGLPTEAEWEYACRAGTTTTYYWGNIFDDRYAWSLRNSGAALREVGTRLPNAWGLYDMSGNLWEWCEDSYEEQYTRLSTRSGRRRLSDGSYRVLRGGSWNVSHEFARSANRSKNTPETRKDYDGFRVVLEVADAP